MIVSLLDFLSKSHDASSELFHIYNTTLGILPKHKWQDITTEEFSFTALNTNNVGSGPYEIKDIKRDENEIITSYELRSFSKYTIKKPFISKIFITFYNL
jgi:ABC-type transport system substrate-binding protein